MRHSVLWFMLIATVFLCIPAAEAEQEPALTIRTAEWSWEEEGIATFEGDVNPEGLPTGPLTLRLSVSAEPDTEEIGDAVFLSVNGKQLMLRKQTSEYSFTLEEGQPVAFTGCWQRPEQTEIRKVKVVLQLLDENGTILQEAGLTAEREEEAPEEEDSNRPGAPFDIGKWILFTGIAAVLVWAAAIIRIHQYNKKK